MNNQALLIGQICSYLYWEQIEAENPLPTTDEDLMRAIRGSD